MQSEVRPEVSSQLALVRAARIAVQGGEAPHTQEGGGALRRAHVEAGKERGGGEVGQLEEEIGVRQLDLGEPSTALRPWGEVKEGPREDSRIASLEKASAWPGLAKDIFLGCVKVRAVRPPTSQH
ncbi:hypothetical protein NDU88_003967 [Pleurodeles waltl]|uniref:Uncharacterized protein n=1 Tax=Pleurodeles waltl TaxID=8319 RepID=A0AAV7SHG5_PLEWA|nr:hypothetical protein NDU88_003967 [Pleurodeles waltl]